MFSEVLVLFGTREAGCLREVAALYSDHLGQLSLDCACLVTDIL